MDASSAWYKEVTGRDPRAALEEARKEHEVKPPSAL